MDTTAHAVPTRELALLGGGAVLAHAIRHAEEAAVRHTQRDVLRQVDATLGRWRHRTEKVSSGIGIAVGAGVLGYLALRELRERRDASRTSAPIAPTG